MRGSSRIQRAAQPFAIERFRQQNPAANPAASAAS
jgi:hypothetical protein